MAPIGQVPVDGELDTLATAFENEAVTSGTNEVGWGQFLLSQKEHQQTGQYGTCSGVMAIRLGRRAITKEVTGGLDALRNKWKVRSTDKEANSWYCQNTRLAFLAMSLAIAESPAHAPFRKEVVLELFQRLQPGGLWGNYYVSKAIYDSTPRVFPSALAVLALSRCNDLSPLAKQALGKAVTELVALLAAKKLRRLDHAAIAAAVLSVGPTQLPRRVRLELNRAASRSFDVEDVFSYFFDYLLDATIADSQPYKRDYIMLPEVALWIIAGRGVNAPSALKLASENLAKALRTRLQKGNGCFVQSSTERPASVDQAWCALSLSWPGGDKPAPLRGRPLYFLLRERKDNVLTTHVLPTTCMLTAIATPIFAPADQVWVKIGYAAFGLLSTAICGKKALRFIPGVGP